MSQRSEAVVLVEPDEAVRAALTTLLESKGWNVLALESGALLHGALEDCQPVAIVSESNLPDMGADEVLGFSQANCIPVIFLGHRYDVQNAVDLMRMGAHDFLEKPFPQTRLLDLLDRLAAKHAAQSA